MVLRGESTAATTVQPRPAGYGGDERYRSYEGQVKTGRAWWPWLLAALVAILLGLGGWLLYDNIRDQIDANEPVAVGLYTGILEKNAVALITQDGFEHNVRRLPNAKVQPGYVYEQDPEAGTKLQKGSIVTILVSSGKPKVTVPRARGQVARRGGSRADAARSGGERRAGELGEAREPGDGPEPAAGRRRARRRVRADQRLVRPQARGRPERDRAELRLGRRSAPVRRLHRRARRRGQRSTGGPGRRPEPAGQLDGLEGLARDAVGLEGPDHGDRPGRLAPDCPRRARDAQSGRLQGHRRQAGDGRPVARRARDVPGAGGERAGRPQVGRDAHRRDVRPSARRDAAPARRHGTTTDTTTDTTTTTDSTTTQTNP